MGTLSKNGSVCEVVVGSPDKNAATVQSLESGFEVLLVKNHEIVDSVSAYNLLTPPGNAIACNDSDLSPGHCFLGMAVSSDGSCYESLGKKLTKYTFFIT